METTTYLSERDAALVRPIGDDEAGAHAEALYQDPRVKRLVHDLGTPLSEAVRLYVGVNCRRPSDVDHFVDFLESLRFLKSEVEKDGGLCAAYHALLPEDRATPVQVAFEISTVILLAIATGAATRIGQLLVDRFRSAVHSQRRSRALMDMLLGSPIPSLLSREESGLTADEIGAETGLSPGEVSCFVDRYEERGWLRREKTGGKDVWMIERDSISRFFGL